MRAGECSQATGISLTSVGIWAGSSHCTNGSGPTYPLISLWLALSCQA
jgi:hypothetical protein